MAESWAEHFTYGATTLSLDPDLGTADTGDHVVREARSDELGDVADQVNEFYASAECYGPATAEKIERFLARSPIDEPVRRYLIALDGDEIVAGVTVEDMYKSM